NRRPIPIPRFRTPAGCTESYSRAARRRSLRSRGRPSPNSAAKKTRTHPTFALAPYRRRSRPAPPDRTRPTSPPGPRGGDVSRRAYRLPRRIQSPQRSRKQRQRTFDRRGKAYGLPLVAPNTRFSGNLSATLAKARLRCASFPTRLINVVALHSNRARIQRQRFVGQDGQI